VMVTEQNAALRDGILAVIGVQPDMDIVGTASDAGQALVECRRTTPHVVIVDADIPNAIDFMRQVRADRPHTKVIALVNYEWDSIVHAAGQASGSPCLPKDHIGRCLVALIRQRDH